MKKMQFKERFKRVLSGTIALTMTTSSLVSLPASADELPKYPYAVFAQDSKAGVTVSGDGFTLNGNAYTNGKFSTSTSYSNVNGMITEFDDLQDSETTDGEDFSFDVNHDMILIHNRLTNMYFTENCDTYDEDFTISDNNINFNNSTYVTGRINLEGNVNLNSALGAVSDIKISNGNINANNCSVIYSKFGDIEINDSCDSVNGLIYAPFGTVTINSDNFNMDGIIIARKVVINSKNVNINYNNAVAEIVGINSEDLSWTYNDWQYLADTDKDGLPNLIEEDIGTDPYNPDTDGDGLPDGYESLTLGTDSLKVDTDNNGINDGDEDFDKDGLINLSEYEKNTEPYNEDTDGDGLKDGEEVNTYGTDPLKKDTDDDGLDDGDEIYFQTDPMNSDTDGNGIKDGDEKREQTFVHKVENADCAVTEVRVSMAVTGNLQKTTDIESVMNKDVLCTGVVGLVGEPFSIETTSQFDKATLTFAIDKSKLGDTKFDNLMFLWYNEEENNFVELKTTLDEINSTASIETTHFSRYMIVDRQKWFDNWRKISIKYKDLYSVYPSITSICVDCSGSMEENDPTQNINGEDTCYRNLAVKGFVDAMLYCDKTSVITFEGSAKEVCALTSNKTILKNNAEFYNGGWTNANDAIEIALKELDDENGKLNIILMTDGQSSILNTNIQKAIDRGIRIHTIGLGEGANNINLKNYSNQTGGEHFTATTADELEKIYSNISEKNQLSFDGMSDSDGDGVPDDVENSGIPMPNGEIVFTNPNKFDTDEDGLSDGDEVGKLKRVAPAYGTPEEAVVYKFYLNIESNPTKEDSDGDGINDYDETMGVTFTTPEGTKNKYQGEPLKKGLANDVTGRLTLISCHDGESGWTEGHAFFVYTSYIDDKLDFSKFSYGWSRKNRTESWSWENLQEDETTQSEYAISIGESVSVGLGAENESILKHNGFNYNMEVYKRFNKNYNSSYDTNAYVYQDISEEKLCKLIDYCTDDSRNYWNPTHNCAVIACGAWNVISDDKVNSKNDSFLFGEVSTPKGLYKYLESNNLGSKNYTFSSQFQ